MSNHKGELMSNYPNLDKKYEGEALVMDRPRQSLHGAADGVASSLAKAASEAHEAIKSTQDVASSALSKLDRKIDSALPKLDLAAKRFDEATRSSLQAVKKTAVQTRRQVREAGESTIGFLRREPVKGAAMSVVLGAVFMALFSWIGRERSVKQRFGSNDDNT
jgi:ElaB/YqjD/DUF883 family membrane-anchored ribosome-binding protein